jgi:hypothetical protein
MLVGLDCLTYPGSLKLIKINWLSENVPNIAEFCKRTTPSKRDRILLKDLPLLFWQIANQPVTTSKIA